MTPTQHLDDLAGTIRRMQQRQQGVQYNFGQMWADHARTLEKLRKLEHVTHMMRTPCGEVAIRFDDGSTATGADIWEALA